MITEINKKRVCKLLLSVSACTILAACQTTQSPDQSHTAKMDSALERAASAASSSGGATQSIGYLEKIYKRNSNDVNAALNYAAALRETEYVSRAAAVLEPFANDAGSPAAVKTEYAAIQLAQGNYSGAEKYAQMAIRQDEADYKAYHYLGIALDGKGEHEKAERAFRKGLDHWQGDPTAIMNNLALNLASQGFLEEALEILHKAQAVAPQRLEIERNLRIVRALQQSSGGYNAPKPKPRPAVPAPVVEKDPILEKPQAVKKEAGASKKDPATKEPQQKPPTLNQ